MKEIEKKVIGGSWDLTYDAVTQSWEITSPGIFGVFARITKKEGMSVQATEATARAMANAGSMANALWAIANMQVDEHTDKSEVLALCMSIAKIEIEKMER